MNKFRLRQTFSDTWRRISYTSTYVIENHQWNCVFITRVYILARNQQCGIKGKAGKVPKNWEDFLTVKANQNWYGLDISASWAPQEIVSRNQEVVEDARRIILKPHHGFQTDPTQDAPKW